MEATRPARDRGAHRSRPRSLRLGPEIARRRAAAAVTLLLLSLVALTALPARASTADEGRFVTLINQERAARGLGALEVYWDLVDDARAQTQRMIDRGEIYHNPDLGSVTSGWYSLGENVGVGPDADRLHVAFMNSPGHAANVLGDFNYVGVGADRAPDGSLYVTVVFMKGPAGLVTPATTTTTTTTTTTVAAPTTTTTTAPATTTTTAPATTTTTAPTTTTTTVAAPTTTTTTAPTTATTTVAAPTKTTAAPAGELTAAPTGADQTAPRARVKHLVEEAPWDALLFGPRSPYRFYII